MSLPLFNWNGGQVIAVSGNYCPIVVPSTQPASQGQAQNQGPLIDLVTYFVSGGSATGTITFQELLPDRATWVLLSTPASQALAATALNGFIQGPFIGIRIVVGGLAVSTITQAILKGTVRS